MQLFTAIGSNRYCGPGTLALLTGYSSDECAAVLAHTAGSHRPGVKPTVLAKAARRLGIAMSLVHDYRDDPSPPTIGTVGTFPALRGGTYVVATKGRPGHLLILQLDGPTTPMAADNKTGGLVKLNDYAYHDAFVEGIWRVGPVRDFSAMLQRVQDRRALAETTAWSWLARDAEKIADELAAAERIPTPPPTPPPVPTPAPIVVGKVLRQFVVSRDASGRMIGALEVEVQ